MKKRTTTKVKTGRKRSKGTDMSPRTAGAVKGGLLPATALPADKKLSPLGPTTPFNPGTPINPPVLRNM